MPVLDSQSPDPVAPRAPLPPELLLAAIVDSSDDAIVSKTLDGTITSWNRAAERVFGYRAEEIIGRSVLTLIPTHLQSEETEIIRRLKRGERIDHFESVRRRKDGSLFPVSLTISPIKDATGRIIGASKIARDVSRQREAAQAGHLLAAIVASSDDAIISKSLDGTITSWNHAAERIYGYTAAEMIGSSVLRVVPPELHGEESQVLARLAQGERIEHHETSRIRKDGTRIEVSLTISPIRDGQGRIIGASKIARDITRQRKTDEAVRLLAAIVDSSDDAIVSKNLDGIITSWNAAAQRMFGYTAEEAIGRHITLLVPPDRAAEEAAILDQLRRGERVDHYQTVRVRRDGTPFDVSLTISPIKDRFGRVVGASNVSRDITREKAAIAQIELANEELKRADRMKAEFLAIMSHELRTPLNSIIGFASVLRQGRHGPLTDDQKKQLNLIHASGKHLLSLITDLLDLSRIESGRMDLDAEEFLPCEVVQQAIRTLELQAAQKQLPVRLAVEGSAPVFTDRKRFYQVVLNLLNNAIKFTPSGAIDLRLEQTPETLVLEVTDTGIGIATEQQAGLFRPFHQVESSARRRYEGTGLGLYLCRKLVTLMGGTIGLVSQVNRGSTFTVRLPSRLPENAPAHSAAA